jgi:glycerol kinase
MGGNSKSGNSNSDGKLNHPRPAAIGITNQRETVVAWNRKTGRPFYNALVWMDTRTSGVVKQLVGDGAAASKVK